MKDYIQHLLAESAMQGRSPLDARSGCGCNHKPEPTVAAPPRPSREPRAFAPPIAFSPSPSAGPPLTPVPNPHNAPYPIYTDPNFDPCDTFVQYPCETALLTVRNYTGGLPYIRPRLSALSVDEVDRIVIPVHGGLGNLSENYPNHAASMYQFVYNSWLNPKSPAPPKAPGGKEVAVFAPVFQDLPWIPYTLYHPGIWYWEDGSWVAGRRPNEFNWEDLIEHFYSKPTILTYPRNALIQELQEYFHNASGYSEPGPSSYLIMDELIRVALKIYPKATSVTLVGHSGGGSFVSHYAMMDRGISSYVNTFMGSDSKGPLRYIALDSGVYPYSIPQRYVPAPYRSHGADNTLGTNCFLLGWPPFSVGEWQIPDLEGTNGVDYDDWPYGTGSFTNLELAAGVPWQDAVYYASTHTSANSASPRRLLKFNMMRQDLHIFQERTDCKNWTHESLRLLQQGANIQEIFYRFRESLTWNVNYPPEMQQAQALQSRMKAVFSGNFIGNEHSTASMMSYPEIRNLMFYL